VIRVCREDVFGAHAIVLALNEHRSIPLWVVSAERLEQRAARSCPARAGRLAALALAAATILPIQPKDQPR
jgi:hypothetical protein